MHRLITHLTVSTRCAWCEPKRTLHRAIFHRCWSDVICEDCMAAQRRQIKLMAVKPIKTMLEDVQEHK